MARRDIIHGCIENLMMQGIMSDYLLTIVTVTKNCAATVDRTLASVQAIKGSGIEYLVIDGVSTDGTLDAVRRYGSTVDHLVSEPDTGIYNAMNKGVALAQGRYVLFINGDDELATAGFPDVMAAMRKDDADIISATTLVGATDHPSEVLIAQPWRLLFLNSIPHPSSFVATTLLRRFPFREDLRIVSDYDFFLRAYLARCRFRVLPVVTALHQRGGASGNVERSAAELDQVRRHRLGILYFPLNVIASGYRLLKWFRGGAVHG